MFSGLCISAFNIATFLFATLLLSSMVLFAVLEDCLYFLMKAILFSTKGSTTSFTVLISID